MKTIDYIKQKNLVVNWFMGRITLHDKQGKQVINKSFKDWNSANFEARFYNNDNK